MDKLHEDILNMIENNKDSSPALVGHQMISMAVNLLLSSAHNRTDAMELVRGAVLDGSLAHTLQELED